MPLLTKDDISTCIYPEIRDLITRQNDTLLSRIIENGEGEAKAHLSRFDLVTMFAPTFSDQYLKGICIDLVCWHLIKLANPNIDIALFRTAYEDAIKTLEKIARGLISPAGWPLRPSDTGNPPDLSGNIEFTSNPKRHNYY